ncbi:XRE family transcriptional regulator [bacterium]|jgi:transcriptional regulator with XRE-family HTH domain|nr:XRE family transcriptional regulator [bacterium]NBO36611.1 XRE family transcriptional regulator [bacterium]
MEIGEQLKKLREKLNISQDRFGKRIGVTGKTVSAYETGKIIPSLDILKKISEEYNVTFFRKNNREIERRIDDIQKSLHELQKLFKESLSF